MSLTRDDLAPGRLQEMISQSGLPLSFLSEAELQDSLHQTLKQRHSHKDVWLFAYGSLIWNPVFEFVDRQIGTIYGFHRRFCLWTPAGRGTPDNPGLVLGLDRGGSCRGVAFRVAATEVMSELMLVWRREMIVGSYVPRWVKVFNGVQECDAITFVINRQHNRYAGALPPDTIISSIATAKGQLGSSADYLMHTVDGLLHAGIKDRYLLLLRQQVLARQQSLQTALSTEAD
jgi:cation transport protein ChaC